MNKPNEEIDEMLYKYFEDKSIPEEISKSIDEAFKYNKKKHKITFNIKKIIIIILSISMISSGIAFASVILVKKMFNYNHGIESATENDYIQNIEMKYIRTDNLSFKVSYLVMDDVNFSLVFDYIVPDNMDNFDAIALHNLKITDEIGNHILYDTEGDDLYNNYAFSHSEWKLVEKNNNYVRQVLQANSYDFPKSKKIHITFNGITLYTVENGIKNTKDYNGNWSLEFDVSDQLQNRNVKYYSCKDERIQEVKLTNSGLVIKAKSDKYLENIHLYDDKNNEYKLFYNTQNRSREKRQYITNEWIIFFDTCIYDNVQKYKLKIDDIEYTLFLVD